MIIKNKHIGYTLTLLILSLNIIASQLAMDSITILNVTNSGKSIIINRGVHDGIRPGMRAKFIHQQSTDRPKLTFIAAGEAVKVYDTKSYWYLNNIEKPNKIVVNNTLGLITLDHILQGRRKLSILQKKAIVNSPDEKNDFDKESSLNLPYSLIEMDNRYFRTKKIVEQNTSKHNDTQTIDFDIWEPINSDDSLSGNMDSVQNPDLIRDHYEESLAEVVISNKVTEADGRRINVKKRNLDMKNKKEYQNAYSKFLSIKNKRALILPGVISKIKRDGPLWSADMSDENLRKFLLKSGIAYERERRKRAFNNKSGHEIFIHYAIGLYDSTSSYDQENKGTGNDLTFGYEFHLEKTSELLRKWSINLSYSRGHNYYDIGNLNASSDEISYKSIVNWYFYNEPTTVKKYIMYLGLGIKRGEASLSSTHLDKKYFYQIKSFPSYHLGLKYRFYAGDEYDEFWKWGLGINWKLSYELLQLTANEGVFSNTYGVIDVYDLKMAIGFNIYF